MTHNKREKLWQCKISHKFDECGPPCFYCLSEVSTMPIRSQENVMETMKPMSLPLNHTYCHYSLISLKTHIKISFYVCTKTYNLKSRKLKLRMKKKYWRGIC